MVRFSGVGALGIYLILVIPAGLAVFINKLKFKRSPDRIAIENVIEEYRGRIGHLDRNQLDKIIETKQREVIERNAIQYSVEYYATKDKKGKYSIVVSVGRLSPVTVGHAVKFEL